jgi:dTDP-4-dehydrorhamnose reductase
MMKLLITGSNGQLGLALQHRLRANHEIVALDRASLDIADRNACTSAIAAVRPDVVLNCAAYTAVDRAESERELAFAINANGPRFLARAARDANAFLIHFSTDYVFDGVANLANGVPRPYLEGDATAPLGVYGESKLEGECAVVEETDRYAIFRLSWVYSNDGANFYKTMLRLANERDHLRVVADQIGIPNFTGDIADAIAHVLAREREVLDRESGVYHLSARGKPISWHHFASEIFANAQLAKRPTVDPIATSGYPTPAKRPAYSALDSSRFAATFQWDLPDWRAGLQRCLAERVLSA